jgi:hypothetical protein
MHQMRERVVMLNAKSHSSLFKKAAYSAASTMDFSEMVPEGMGLATMRAFAWLTMLLKSMSALFPAHCLKREVQMFKKR